MKLKQVEKLTLARELLPLLGELIDTEIRRRGGSFDSLASKRANDARWRKRREDKALQAEAVE
jgi:hypothetical protein